jgi:hypothetical protein
VCAWTFANCLQQQQRQQQQQEASWALAPRALSRSQAAQRCLATAVPLVTWLGWLAALQQGAAV